MTSTFRRIVAAAALISALALPLSACGSSPASLPVPTTYCVGPERINDIGDLVHREMVRYPDEYCAGALPQGFALVSAGSWGDVPDVGEDVVTDSYWGYHRTRVYRSHVVVHVVNPPTPPRTSVLIVRDPTVGSPAARASASTAAQRARKAGVSGAPTSSPQAGPNGRSTISRGGLGVSSGGADKQDVATQQKLKAQTDAASRAAAVGRAKTSASKTTAAKSAPSSRSTSKSGPGR